MILNERTKTKSGFNPSYDPVSHISCIEIAKAINNCNGFVYGNVWIAYDLAKLKLCILTCDSLAAREP